MSSLNLSFVMLCAIPCILSLITKAKTSAHSYQEETSLLSMPYFSRLGDPTGTELLRKYPIGG